MNMIMSKMSIIKNSLYIKCKAESTNDDEIAQVDQDNHEEYMESYSEGMKERDKFIKKIFKENTNREINSEDKDAAMNIYSNLTFVQRFELLMQRDSEDGSILFTNKCVSYLPFSVCFIATGITGSLASLNIMRDFRRANQTTSWPTVYFAQRRFYDHVIHKSVAFGFRIGVRLGFMTAGFFSLPILLNMAIGESQMWTRPACIIGCAALYPFFHGPRAMLIGGGIMALPGLALGAAFHWTEHLLELRVEDEICSRLAKKHMEDRIYLAALHSKTSSPSTSSTFPVSSLSSSSLPSHSEDNNGTTIVDQQERKTDTKWRWPWQR